MKVIKQLILIFVILMTISNVVNSEETNSQDYNLTETSIPISEKLTITSSIRINGVNVEERGTRIIDKGNLECIFSVYNSSAMSDSVIAILATYTLDGKLYNVETVNATVDAEQTEDVEILYQFDTKNESTGKLMIWNTSSNLIPVRASIDFSQTSGVNAYYYNADNRLLQIDKIDGKSVIFTYDNMGNLLSRTIRE